MDHLAAARYTSIVYGVGFSLLGFVSLLNGKEPTNTTIILPGSTAERVSEALGAMESPVGNGTEPTFNIISTLGYVLLFLFLLMITIVFTIPELPKAWNNAQGQFDESMYWFLSFFFPCHAPKHTDLPTPRPFNDTIMDLDPTIIENVWLIEKLVRLEIAAEEAAEKAEELARDTQKKQSDMITEIGELEDELDGLKREIAILHGDAASNEAHRKGLKSQADTEKDAKEEALRERDEARKEAAQGIEDYKKIEDVNQDLEEKKEKLVEDIKKLKERYHNGFSKLKSEFRALEEYNGRLKQEKTDFGSETHKTQLKMKAVNKRIAELEKQLKDLKESQELEITMAKSALKQELDDLNNNYEELHNDYEELNNDHEEVKGELSAAEEKNSKLEDDLRKVREDKARYKSSSEAHKKASQDAVNTCKDLVVNYEKLKNKHLDVTAELEGLQDEKERLEDIISEMETAQEELDEDAPERQEKEQKLLNDLKIRNGILASVKKAVKAGNLNQDELLRLLDESTSNGDEDAKEPTPAPEDAPKSAADEKEPTPAPKDAPLGEPPAQTPVTPSKLTIKFGGKGQGTAPSAAPAAQNPSIPTNIPFQFGSGTTPSVDSAAPPAQNPSFPTNIPFNFGQGTTPSIQSAVPPTQAPASPGNVPTKTDADGQGSRKAGGGGQSGSGGFAKASRQHKPPKMSEKTWKRLNATKNNKFGWNGSKETTPAPAQPPPQAPADPAKEPSSNSSQGPENAPSNKPEDPAKPPSTPTGGQANGNEKQPPQQESGLPDTKDGAGREEEEEL